MHPNSQLLFEKYAQVYFLPGMRVLEIGPDRFPSTYQSMVGDDSITWETLDIYDSPHLTFSASSDYSVPIPNNTYDIVLSGQVIEHVRRIWVWMQELARICKIGGVVITINPVSWPAHGAPIDCWRAFPEGMTALYEDAALEVLLSQYESLEIPNYRKYVPGRSPGHQYDLSPWQETVLRILGRLGFPVERAYDTITIGKKLGYTPYQGTASIPT